MNQLRPLLKYVRPYRAGIALGLLLILISNGAGVAGPWLIGEAIDAIGAPDLTGGRLALYAAAIIAVAAVSGAGRFGMRYQLNGISRRIENDLRDDFFDHLLRLDARFYDRTRTGDLMSRATNDTQAVRQAVGPGIMYSANTVVMTAFSVAFMVQYSLSLTLVAAIPLLLLPPVMSIFGRIIHRRFERIQEHFGELSTMVQENLSGVRIVRAYVQESAQEEEFAELNRGYHEKNMALARTSALFQPLLSLLTGLGALIVLIVGGRQVMSGTLTPGEFVAFGVYLGMLTWPMIALGWVINLFQRGAASMGRMNRIFEMQPAVADPTDPIELAAARGTIEFRDVSFRYPGTDREVLSGVSFRIEAGETAAIVGPTGSGKSTIVALLTRRYDPTRGQILIDDVPLDRIPLAQLRAAIGVVPQDTFVFSETIGDNIGLGLPAADPRIRAAADVAQLTSTVEAFPAAFDTLLGERGVNLSGGQRQRTTLARAVARDPRILILDDALSAVDTATETEILKNLRTVMRTRTALIISHRMSAVMEADRIFVLDEGRIVERGRHADLIEAQGLYATLLRRQLLADALDQGRLPG